MKKDKKMYAIISTLNVDDRPNVEVLFFDESLNEVEKVFKQIVKVIKLNAFGPSYDINDKQIKELEILNNMGVNIYDGEADLFFEVINPQIIEYKNL